MGERDQSWPSSMGSSSESNRLNRLEVWTGSRSALGTLSDCFFVLFSLGDFVVDGLGVFNGNGN